MRFSLVRRSSSRDDGRRSSNDLLTPRDGCRLTAHTTRRPTTVEADKADIRLSANENRSSAASDVASDVATSQGQAKR